MGAVPGLLVQALGLAHLTDDHWKKRRQSLKEDPDAKSRFGMLRGKWVAGENGGFVDRKRSLYEVVLCPGGLAESKRQKGVNHLERRVCLEDLQLPLCEIQVTVIAVRGSSLSDQSAMEVLGGEVLL